MSGNIEVTLDLAGSEEVIHQLLQCYERQEVYTAFSGSWIVESLSVDMNIDPYCRYLRSYPEYKFNLTQLS